MEWQMRGSRRHVSNVVAAKYRNDLNRRGRRKCPTTHLHLRHALLDCSVSLHCQRGQTGDLQLCRVQHFLKACDALVGCPQASLARIFLHPAQENQRAFGATVQCEYHAHRLRAMRLRLCKEEMQCWPLTPSIVVHYFMAYPESARPTLTDQLGPAVTDKLLWRHVPLCSFRAGTGTN